MLIEKLCTLYPKKKMVDVLLLVCTLLIEASVLVTGEGVRHK